MVIAQVVLPGASEYERKSQRIDERAFRRDHVVDTFNLRGNDVFAGGDRSPARNLGRELQARRCDVAHVYGDPRSASFLFRDLGVPYVAPVMLEHKRLPWRRATQPVAVVAPTGPGAVPEAVDDVWFEFTTLPTSVPSNTSEKKTIGSFGPRRKNVKRTIELTCARLHRFRDDIEWALFDEAPTPAEIAKLDAWVDPSEEGDLDGFVAEAVVAGGTTIAARTQINSERLGFGRLGFLVPPADPNELAHAILAALFKPEESERKLEMARFSRDKFRVDVRANVLANVYETAIRWNRN